MERFVDLGLHRLLQNLLDIFLKNQESVTIYHIMINNTSVKNVPPEIFPYALRLWQTAYLHSARPVGENHVNWRNYTLLRNIM